MTINEFRPAVCYIFEIINYKVVRDATHNLVPRELIIANIHYALICIYILSFYVRSIIIMRHHSFNSAHALCSSRTYNILTVKVGKYTLFFLSSSSTTTIKRRKNPKH